MWGEKNSLSAASFVFSRGIMEMLSRSVRGYPSYVWFLILGTEYTSGKMLKTLLSYFVGATKAVRTMT
jgi:hypothetical protein